MESLYRMPTTKENELYDHPSAMLRWLESPEGVMLLTYINSLLEFSRRRLEKETEPVELYRRQGRIDGLKVVADLPEELRQIMSRSK